MIIDKNFKEFIQLLNEHSVRYLIVGGYAVALHGHPRYTKDLDVWLWIDRDNVTRLLNALTAFGFQSLQLTEDDFMEPDRVIQLGYPPSRIDLLTEIDGVDFEACYPSRVSVDIEGIKIDFIDLENLKKNKRASGRHQDLADLDNLH